VKMRNPCLFAALAAVFVSGGSAEAYVGYGYRANAPVRVDHCYRSPALDYAASFYVVGPNRTRHTLKHRHHRAKDRHHASQCCCGGYEKGMEAPLK
jgi:hypothetical protein